MLDRITSMRVFMRTAAAGSLSGAARQLGMSAAMATKHVDATEARLGVKLFHRTTRRLSLTEAGSRYLEACQRILGDFDEAEAEIASQRAEAVGLLRMNLPLEFGVRFVAPLLPHFSHRHPAVRVELGLSDHQLDLLDGGWDMGIRIGRLADSPLQARRLCESPMLLCASPAYLAQHGTPRRVADLAQHNCLGYTLSASGGASEWGFGLDGRVRVRIEGNLVANNGAALVAAAVGGQGLIYQPQFVVAGALRAGELVALELDHPPLELGGVHAIYPRDRHPPAKVRAMIDFLADAFSGTPPWALS